MKLISLSTATWHFRDSSSRSWLPATVPGCVHTDLLAAGKIPDPFFGANESAVQWVAERDWEYRTTFQLSAADLQADAHELVADGLDTLATVTLNGKIIGRTENMFVGYRWPVRTQLRQGRNELRVLFRSATQFVRTKRTEFTPPREFCDPVGNAVRLRKQPSQFGWDWAPRLVTAGIWRDLRLEWGSANRLAHAQIVQRHRPDGVVELEVTPEFARATAPAVELTAICSLDGVEVARATGSGAILRLEIKHPQRWWPAGHGAQPLYDFALTASATGEACGSLRRRLGLRAIVLDRHADEWGESFQFVVNGRPIFIKGANWIPAHSLVTTLTRERYSRDLTAAVAANMNCLRLWGGGIYESEHFYDLCDELGLLIWHDFMFSCALYPADAAFVESVNAEAVYQVKRIHHRAALALWCGNNELTQLNGKALSENPALMAGYKKIFHDLLPAIVSVHDGVTAYWPSSEWRGTFENGHALGEQKGDSHYWDVWHARHPVKDYEKWAFRFCSEFGMQSYSSPATNATFCAASEANIFGPSMENHQKNALGNQIILDYVARRYRFPNSQDGLIYLSQLNQAYCMQVGVEHFRRLMPRCMGALYWQLNDCWPATSWSSIEFTGRWKALHYTARRFFAPALVTAHVPGDETTGIGNTRTSTVEAVHLYTVYDAPDAAVGLLRWDLFHLDGTIFLSGKKRVILRYGASVRQKTLHLRRQLAAYGREKIYLRIALDVANKTVSDQTIFLTPPRSMALPRGRTRVTVAIPRPREATLTFTSTCFQHAVAFDFPGLEYRADDNFFDLYPGEPRQVRVRFTQAVSRSRLVAAMSHHSLVDTYD